MEIMNQKARQSTSQQLRHLGSSLNQSFLKRTDHKANSSAKSPNMSLRSILDRKNDAPNSPTVAGFSESSIQQDLIKKYASSNLENFVIEEETGWNQEDDNSAKVSLRQSTGQNEFLRKDEPTHDEPMLDEDQFYDGVNDKILDHSDQLEYATEVVGFCLESESKNKLFKVTEEDTNHEKFSITVNSDKFQTNSKRNSELNSLKKKANESDALIKDIYQVDLEQDNFKKMIQNDIKLSAHQNYDEMSSSNEAKFMTYKSDMRNRHFNTQIPADSEASQTSFRNNQFLQPQVSDSNTSDHKTPKQPMLPKPAHPSNQAILEKIQESFSDHEEQEEMEAGVDSSCIRETYTVDSSSDDQETNNAQENENSLFSDLSQVAQTTRVTPDQSQLRGAQLHFAAVLQKQLLAQAERRKERVAVFGAGFG